nr:CopG family antitoxin [uncultured Blautia sp.]
MQKEFTSMKPLKNKVSITLDEDIINRIKELAEEDDRSFSQYINLVLRDHIRSIEKSAIK